MQHECSHFYCTIQCLCSQWVLRCTNVANFPPISDFFITRYWLHILVSSIHSVVSIFIWKCENSMNLVRKTLRFNWIYLISFIRSPHLDGFFTSFCAPSVTFSKNSFPFSNLWFRFGFVSFSIIVSISFCHTPCGLGLKQPTNINCQQVERKIPPHSNWF